jgi:hypothetical protein
MTEVVATPENATPAEAPPVEAPPAPATVAPVVSATTATDGPLTKATDERKSALDAALARYGAGGWRIENRSDFQATIAKGHRVNHVLHLILTIVTLGLWAVVWILMVIFGGEKRELVTVDPYGNIVNTKV